MNNLFFVVPTTKNNPHNRTLKQKLADHVYNQIKLNNDKLKPPTGKSHVSDPFQLKRRQDLLPYSQLHDYGNQIDSGVTKI